MAPKRKTTKPSLGCLCTPAGQESGAKKCGSSKLCAKTLTPCQIWLQWRTTKPCPWRTLARLFFEEWRALCPENPSQRPPRCLSDVQRCLDLAQSRWKSIYPKNWGPGARHPVPNQSTHLWFCETSGLEKLSTRTKWRTRKEPVQGSLLERLGRVETGPETGSEMIEDPGEGQKDQETVNTTPDETDTVKEVPEEIQDEIEIEIEIQEDIGTGETTGTGKAEEKTIEIDIVEMMIETVEIVETDTTETDEIGIVVNRRISNYFASNSLLAVSLYCILLIYF